MVRKQASGLVVGAALMVLLIGALVLLHPPASNTAPPTTSTSTYSYTAANPGQMSFGVLDQSLAYGIPSYKDNAQVQQADLSMLESTGAQCIRVDIGYGPWLTGNQTTISVISSTVNSIKASGRCLIIADSSSESYRNGGQIPWAQFKAAWVQRVSTLAALYHPQYYIVVKEPGWYVPFVSDARTNPAFQNVSDWLGLTQNLTSAVHAASPSTQIGVAVAANSLAQTNRAFYAQYLNEVQQLSGISFIGFDVYSLSDQAATQSYLAGNPPSKPVWIAEAWSSPRPTNTAQAQSDAAWMASLYQFGKQIGTQMLIPFYTDLFSGYSVPTNTQALVTFYQGRTPVYGEFTSIVTGVPA